MTKASELFTQVFFTLTQKWSDTSSFRRLVRLGFKHASKMAAAENVEAAERFLNDPANDALFIDKAKFLESFGGSRALATLTTESQLTAFRASVDRASLVFMHSALDGAVYDCCRAAR